MDNNAKSRNQIIKDAVQRGLVGGTSGAMAMTIQVRFFFTKNCTFKEVLSYSGINTHVDANDHELSVQIWHFNNSSNEAFVAWRQNPKILPRLWSSTTSRSHFQIRRYSCKCWHFGIVRVQYWIAYSFENRCGFNYSWGLEDLHYANWHSQDHITGNWHFPSLEQIAFANRVTLPFYIFKRILLTNDCSIHLKKIRLFHTPIKFSFGKCILGNSFYLE